MTATVFKEATLRLALWRAGVRGITVALLRQAPLARGTVYQDWDGRLATYRE